MTRKARLSDSEFNPESHRFDLASHAERLVEASNDEFDSELNFDSAPRSQAERVRRAARESRFN